MIRALAACDIILSTNDLSLFSALMIRTNSFFKLSTTGNSEIQFNGNPINEILFLDLLFTV
jgi:hypothetical protein